MNKTNIQQEHTNSISEETLLKISKEIAVKFIETGRLTPDTFEENFTKIYTIIKSTVTS